MAAIEAGELRDARSLADDALRASRRGVDSVNEARAELLLRQCAYRDRAAPAVDEELLNSASGLDRGGTRGALRLTEAAVAWRARRLSLGGALAWAAADDLRASGFEAGALLAAALGVACGERADPELLALFQSRAERLEPAGLVAQATALAFGTFGAPALSEPLLLRARKWAREAPLPDTPREVLSPAEAASRLDPVRLVAPKGTN
jgi:hypothetical protein